MRSLILPSIFLLSWSHNLLAQQECLKQVKLPKVGSWAEYRGTYQQKDPLTIRYAVIGSETRAGKQLQWVEMRMAGSEKDRSMIYQVLVPGSLAEMDQVEEVVFKPGDNPAMKMNGAMLNMVRGQLEKHAIHGRICQGVTLVGKETLTVPAGKFEAGHFRNSEHGVDSWVTPAVPFSVVKTTGKDFEMELTAKGDGAKSSITETPQEMGGLGGTPQGN
jgi:hypothetical protein